ncbi:MAG TPA: acetyl-CoA carboxylase biotin carboxyl carrier protein [Bryobacteraceae bacterium]|nr:acetyl-CoA carboxylase biotin carboxyl carrier protein [Bryobacteraceae bacterium]
MSNDEIRELIQLVVETGIAELELQRGEDRVRIRRAIGTSQEILIPTGSAATPAAPAPSAGVSVSAPASPAAPAPSSNEVIVKSPIVGTFYESPKPGDPPFVKVGDAVEPGQVLCIIESMKLMNEIESEVAGTIVAKLMENGRPVEYGEALFTIRPR